MRRRRKTKYTWLPIQNGAQFGGEDTADRSWQQFFLEVPATGANITGITPVVADLPQGSLTTVETEGIGEIVGNEYILKRIVGSCFAEVTYLATDDVDLALFQSSPVVVTAGWFVARSDPANPALPVAFTAEGNELYSPQNAFLTRQPWIWRRTWILGIGATGPNFITPQGTAIPTGTTWLGRASFPFTNAAYGSVKDGPHVDARTARRIRLEERLWFCAAACTYLNSGFQSPGIEASVTLTVDTRYLGALRRPRSRSNFA